MPAAPRFKSINPLKQVLDAVDESVESKVYDRVRHQDLMPGSAMQAMYFPHVHVTLSSCMQQADQLHK